MAASFARAARQSCRLFSLAKPRVFAQNNIRPSACFISTSKKNKDSASISEHIESAPNLAKEENLNEKEENWISYGYSLTDRDEDEWANHMTLFIGLTICICGIGFVLTYFPDLKDREWTQREAYLELAKREHDGLPLIDRNIVSPTQFDLPSDEELGDTEIVI